MDEEVIYVVSGIMRSGSSMMMKALEAGGMELLYDPTRDEENETVQFNGEQYEVNPGGSYESYRYLSALRPAEWVDKCRGKVIKNLYPGLMTLPKIDVFGVKYKILFMLRDPVEIEMSWVVSFHNLTPKETIGVNMEYYAVLMDDICSSIEEARDSEVIQVHYDDVMDNPKAAFRKIRDAGWPISPKKAAVVIDPRLHRMKREN